MRSFLRKIDNSFFNGDIGLCDKIFEDSLIEIFRWNTEKVECF